MVDPEISSSKPVTPSYGFPVAMPRALSTGTRNSELRVSNGALSAFAVSLYKHVTPSYVFLMVDALLHQQATASLKTRNSELRVFDRWSIGVSLRIPEISS